MRDACQRRAPVPRVWHGCGVLQDDGFTGAADEAMSMDVRNVYPIPRGSHTPRGPAPTAERNTSDVTPRVAYVRLV